MNDLTVKINDKEIVYKMPDRTYKTGLLSEIKVIKLFHFIKKDEDDSDINNLKISVTLKSGIRDTFDILNIDYKIDTLEQILMHIAKNNNIYLSLPKYEKPNFFSRIFNIDFM